MDGDGIILTDSYDFIDRSNQQIHNIKSSHAYAASVFFKPGIVETLFQIPANFFKPDKKLYFWIDTRCGIGHQSIKMDHMGNIEPLTDDERHTQFMCSSQGEPSTTHMYDDRHIASCSFTTNIDKKININRAFPTVPVVMHNDTPQNPNMDVDTPQEMPRTDSVNDMEMLDEDRSDMSMDEDDEELCIMCYEYIRDTVVQPCGCFVVCAKCSDGLHDMPQHQRKCIHCRQQIESIHYLTSGKVIRF